MAGIGPTEQRGVGDDRPAVAMSALSSSRKLPIGGAVRREHGLRPSTQSCTASDMICASRECRE